MQEGQSLPHILFCLWRIALSREELHAMRGQLTVVLCGIETGRIDLALDAARKMSQLLAGCQPQPAEHTEAA